MGSYFDTVYVSYYSLVTSDFNSDLCLNYWLLSWLLNGHFQIPSLLHHLLFDFFTIRKTFSFFPVILYIYMSISTYAIDCNPHIYSMDYNFLLSLFEAQIEADVATNQ